MSTLNEAEREALLAPCKCGHTINDHGSLVACWTCSDADEGEECDTNFEALLCERVAGLVEARLAAGERDGGLRARIEALHQKWWRWSQEGGRIINHAGVAQDICNDLRAALEQGDQTQPGDGGA